MLLRVCYFNLFSVLFFKILLKKDYFYLTSFLLRSANFDKQASTENSHARISGVDLNANLMTPCVWEMCRLRSANSSVGQISWMNEAAAVFLADVQMVDGSNEHRVTINDTFVLSSPSRKIVLSDVPPFIKNETIQGVERYGKLTAPIKMTPLGLKNPDVTHVMPLQRLYVHEIERTTRSARRGCKANA